MQLKRMNKDFYRQGLPQSMTLIRQILTWIFTYIFYPLVVVGVFMYIIIMLRIIVKAANDKIGAIRRATGAFLPLVLLVFLLATNENTIEFIEGPLDELVWSFRFLIGAVLGILLMEAGKRLLEADNDGAAALYALLFRKNHSLRLW